jgi:hypothetical protein
VSTYRIDKLRIVVERDESSDIIDGDPEYTQDRAGVDRREAYIRGDWHFIGVYAELRVSVEGVMQALRSGGLSGIESDGDAYIEEVAEDEYESLRCICRALGIHKLPPLSAAERFVEP